MRNSNISVFWMFIILPGILFAVSSNARIGESQAELKQRFGKPIRRQKVENEHLQQGQLLECKYEVQEIQITAYFENDKCVQIAYFAPVEILTELRIGMLLEKNANGHSWVASKRITTQNTEQTVTYWKREDGTMAEYWILPAKNRKASLVIQLSDYVQRSWISKWSSSSVESSQIRLIGDF